jgi:hypothetical protein
MQQFSIPWSFLDYSDLYDAQPKPASKTLKASTVPETTKTFAQALSHVCEVPESQLPQPCYKGGNLAISIPDDDYEVGVKDCKLNLHGRIIWPKGSTPLTVFNLKNKLKTLWKDLDRWGVSFIGKGFYEFCFSSIEDVRRVRSVSSWNLNPGVLKLFAWQNDFSPSSQKNTSAQVWVKIFGLAQEYWRPRIITAITSSLGSPIIIDAAVTKPRFERTFGQYVRVLVDIDISQELHYKILVERKGFAFFVEVEYENLPQFCTHCNMVGHYLEICKRIQVTEDVAPNKEVRYRNKQKKQAEKIFVPVKGSRAQQDFEKPPEINNPEPIKDRENCNTHNLNLEQPIDPITETVLVNDQIREDLHNIEKSPPLVQSNRFLVLHNDNLDGNAGINENPNHTDDSNACNPESSTHNSPKKDNIESNDDSSTAETDFVDATQVDDEDSISNDSVSNHEAVPIRVQQDMQFLRDSWANIAEIEGAENRLLTELEREEPIYNREEPTSFQMVQSKRKTKLQKKAATNSYSTRSKVGHPKPFK